MDRALLVLSAILLNAALAGPRHWYAALGLTRYGRLPAHLVRGAERRLNRAHRSLQDRELRGIVLVMAGIMASVIVGSVAGWLLQGNLRFIELVIVAACLPVRPTWDCVSQIRKLLYADNIDAARQVLEHTAWRHHVLLDEHGVARAGIEMLAVHFSEKILAPALWYLWLGLPGLLISKWMHLLEETLAAPQVSEREFGKAAAAAHYVLHYLTARLGALFWLAAALILPAAQPRISIPVTAAWWKAPPQEVALLAAATAFRLSLGGPASVYAGPHWIGSGTPRATFRDVRQALRLFALLHLLLFVILGLFL